MREKFITDLLIRFFDILFSLLALIVFLPILLIISIVLIFTGEKEVFYFQERIGQNKIPFKLIKFATMLKNSENIGPGEITLANDPRVLPFGKFLRKTKLNELPQLINILKGDLSIIGPRPQTIKYYNAFCNEDVDYISMVKPGLSGIGSIVFRDEEEILKKVKNPVEFDLDVITPYKGRLESWYANNRSLYLYFKLIVVTIYVVLFPKYLNVVINKKMNGLPNIPDELKKIIGD